MITSAFVAVNESNNNASVTALNLSSFISSVVPSTEAAIQF
jgi:hypothetical protein